MFSKSRKETNRPQERIADDCEVIEKMSNLHRKIAITGKTLNISLPEIVVVGSQSAGKSSVVEGVVGKEFLPRGTGTVTRRPTVIHLFPSEEVYAVFDHKPEQKFDDFALVRNEIVEETNRDPGETGFSPKPIVISIYAPNVLKLSLVDLPGIIEISLNKESPRDVQVVRSIVMEFINRPRTIILAIIPANQDLITCPSMKYVEEADPDGHRTIGVLTKLDLMDEGTNARQILENKKYPLDLGYVGVVNRSQMDIANNKDISFALEKERIFFDNHPAYSRMGDRLGTPFLRKLLHVVLKTHIKKSLPSVKKELSLQLNEVRKELKEFEELMGFDQTKATEGQVQAYLLRLLETFKDDVDSKLVGHRENVRSDKLTAGTVINYHLYERLQEILKLPTCLNEEVLTNLILNLHAYRNVISIPAMTLEAACGDVLKEYQFVLEDIVESVTEILAEAIEESMNSMYLYPLLKSVLMHLITEAIRKSTDKTKDLLENYLEAERSFCNIYRWDFKPSKLENGFPCHPLNVWAEENSGGKTNDSTSTPRNNDTHRSPNASSSSSTDDLQSRSSSGIIEDLPSGSSCSSADDLPSKSGSSLDSTVECVSNKLKLNETAKANARSVANVIQEYLELIQRQIQDVSLKFIICNLVRKVASFIKSELVIKLLTSNELKAIMDECEKDFVHREDMLTTCSLLQELLNDIQSF